VPQIPHTRVLGSHLQIWSTLAEREMPTGADSDPKQLLTYSPNFSFRSSLLLAKRIVYETGPCIA
jgi:hypothetical protein